MARYQVTLAYDGTEFLGFQKQGRSRTVQGELERALRKIGWQGETLLAAGRTDTGVHASGQVVAFDLEWRHTPEALQKALNATLPRDVAVRSAALARPDFHPRFDATARRYQYRVFTQEERDPLQERYAWRVWPAVDGRQLEAAALCLPGRQDFAAFGSPPRPGGSTVRTVIEAGWELDGSVWIFEIKANAFLYHMVRRLVFAQVAIGQGRLPPQALAQRLEDPQLEPLQGLAPPHGLILVEVTYP